MPDDILTQMVQYSLQVRGGAVPACQKHIWACERFLRDVERMGTDEFPYLFNAERAERFFRWFRLFKHRKGVLAGKHIEPAPIQIFVGGNIYGWYHRDTGYRRFNVMYWQVARKNAKSQMLSGMGSYELMAFNERADEAMEIYCAATKTRQARIVYDETKGMLKGCDLLKGKWKEAYWELIHLKSGSRMAALSREDKKSGDGLNPQLGIIDEYHAHETSELYDIIKSGQGARSQPLLAIITTAGFDLNNPCYSVEYRMVSQLLDPDHPTTLDNYFAMVNELEINQTAEDIEIERGGKLVSVPPGELLDDPFDETNWPKANPIVCSYPEGWDNLRNEAAQAQIADEKKRNFLTKHMNVWVNMREAGYINVARWTACRGEIPDLEGRECYVGLDLSSKIDLTSVALEFKIEELYVCLSHSFIPRAKTLDKKKQDLVDYNLWEKQGWITITDGEVVDYRRVIEYTDEWLERLGARAVEWCMDPWGATQIQRDLEERGDEPVEIVQGVKTLCEPTKDFRDMMLLKRLRHDGNPVLTWALGNAIVSNVDRNNNIILNKKLSRERIDPVAALINAHTRCMVSEVYETPMPEFY